MKLNGRRESTNVDDRRRSGGKKAGIGGGIGAIIIAAIFAFIQSGGDLSSVVQTVGSQVVNNMIVGPDGAEHEPTAEEDSLAHFSKQIFASTEDVWSDILKQMGKQYEMPRLVLYTGSVMSACGNGSAAMGPFYCSGDQCVYLDLSFFQTMRKQLGAGGEFANAYVIAHEVGHHIQQQLGILDDAHAQMARSSESESNKISVRLELQADFFAGVWGHYENAKYNSVSDKEIEEAIKCAHNIGDNYLQKQSQGYVVPENFTHGTSEQRMRWFKLGLTTGDIRLGDTFSKSEAEL